jgi:fatty-acyl-CoA synthase
MINLSSFIAFHAGRTPARCALKYRNEDISYADFDDRTRRVAGWLASRGIGADDVVTVLMKNSAAFSNLYLRRATWALCSCLSTIASRRTSIVG